MTPHFNQIHGHARRGRITPTFRTWLKMRERCRDEDAVNFARYGGKGIKVCERWLFSFENFLADMGERPIGESLDRIDSSSDYSKENCRWASREIQARNRSNNRHFEINGQKKCLIEWTLKYEIDYFLVCGRLNAGWEIERALTQPIRKSTKKIDMDKKK